MSEIRVDLITERTADGGVTIKSTGTGDNKPTLLTLQTSEADIAANDVLGKIQFQAPDEGTGTDAILVSAAIQARSEGDFAADANATAIDFMVGASEAAATKMTLSSAGKLDVSGGIDIEGGAVFNEDSADVDFRVESDDNVNMLFVDGGNDRVGIGTNTPDMLLDVTGVISAGAGTDEDLQQWNIGSDNVKAKMTYLDASANRGFAIGTSSQHDFFLRTDNNIGLKVDINGAVTKPLQPAFLTEIAQQDDIATSTNVTLLFNNEIFDTNADFNTSNYKFTAPVTGKYQFNVSVRLNILDTAADYYQIRLSTSNRAITIDTIDPGGFSYDINYYQAAASVVTDMDANDTAHVIIRQQAGTQQTDIESSFDGTFFSGHLVG